MPSRRDLDWLPGSIVGREALARALDAAGARRVLRSVSAPDPIGVDGRLRKLGWIDVASALDAVDVRRVFLRLSGSFQRLSFTFGESFFAFHGYEL